jgi:2-polyprenyl-6-hydroxyphenyl methylase/3-demethylubiquinone-9 3-methyltransferase
MEVAPGYPWSNAELEHSAEYLLPTVLRELEPLRAAAASAGGRPRLFELGCGNGSFANALARQGWDVTGVDPTAEGIAQANAHYPDLKLSQGSSDDDLAARYGSFPVVTSLEVVEHVYLPTRYAATLFSLIEPGGVAIVSTPYHGYWKNLALALTGRMDSHFTALWDYGHVKFWSIKTLGTLLREAGFVDIRFHRVGHIPPFAKSMVAVARKAK